MAYLPEAGSAISFSQIQSYISTRYSVTSPSLRTLSSTDSKTAPDSMTEFFSTGFDVWARNRYNLFNTSNEVSIKYQITPNLQPFNFITIATKSIGTNYEKIGRIVVDPGEITTTNRLRIGCNFTPFNGAMQNIQFGVGLNGTNWNFYCGTTSAPYTVQVTPTGDIYLNINVTSNNGQYVPCG
jgi:hypothetical protein